MSRRARIALFLVLLLIGGVVATTAFAAHRAATAGTLLVQVNDSTPGGSDVHVMVPAIAIDMVAPFVHLALPAEARREMRPWMPLAAAMAENINSLPDAVFVSVEGPEEQVRIAKVNSQLEIRVVSNGESVLVRVPLRSVAFLLHRLEASV